MTRQSTDSPYLRLGQLESLRASKRVHGRSRGRKALHQLGHVTVAIRWGGHLHDVIGEGSLEIGHPSVLITYEQAVMMTTATEMIVAIEMKISTTCYVHIMDAIRTAYERA